MSPKSAMNLPPSADNPLWSPVPRYSAPSPEMLAHLDEARAAMAEATKDLAADCRACGACCDFRHYDHVLFATKLELDAALLWSRENLTITAASAAEALQSNLCPFWRDGRCDIHSARPLGCRAYFCAADQKKLVSSRVDRVLSLYRRNLLGPIGLGWYGPALLYWRLNAITIL